MAGRTVAVFGLGSSGIATAHALAAGGAEIACWDDNRARVDEAWNDGLPTGDLKVADFAAFDALVVSPGVPLTHPEPHWTVQRARAAGLPVIGDIELFDVERRERASTLRLVGITGTNGKSTTTALAGHLIAALGEDVQVGGNIGTPVLKLTARPGIAVVECSSFQIDLAPDLAPEVGLLLNLSPDHLDRHGTMENYAAIKERLVAGSRQAIVGVDDPLSGAIADRLEAAGKPTRRIGTFESVEAAAKLGRSGVAAVGEALYVVSEGVPTLIADLAGVGSLRGQHNAQNAAAAVAICIALGHPASAAAAHLASFPGLAHRLEDLGLRDGVRFINDSKATNAQSTRQALLALDGVHWIAGGKPKAGGITELRDLFGRVKRAYLIGEAAEAFAETLGDDVISEQCGDLETAVRCAAGRAKEEGGVVLLSPACASFDQFKSFEARGDAFRTLVNALPENV